MIALTKEQEQKLVADRCYPPLVASVDFWIRQRIGRARIRRCDFEDCYQHAWMYLLRHCDKFDPALSGFRTWAMFRVRAAVTEWREQQPVVHLPRSVERAAVLFAPDGLNRLQQREGNLHEQTARGSVWIRAKLRGRSMLSDLQRRILADRLEGATFDEIGKAEGLARGSVHWQVNQAVKILAMEWERQD